MHADSIKYACFGSISSVRNEILFDATIRWRLVLDCKVEKCRFININISVEWFQNFPYITWSDHPHSPIEMHIWSHWVFLWYIISKIVLINFFLSILFFLPSKFIDLILITKPSLHPRMTNHFSTFVIRPMHRIAIRIHPVPHHLDWKHQSATQ